MDFKQTVLASLTFCLPIEAVGEMKKVLHKPECIAKHGVLDEWKQDTIGCFSIEAVDSFIFLFQQSMHLK